MHERYDYLTSTEKAPAPAGAVLVGEWSGVGGIGWHDDERITPEVMLDYTSFATDPDRLNFERGLGIPLIRSLVDDVRFESSGTGTAVWMTLFGAPASEQGDETAEILRVVLTEDS